MAAGASRCSDLVGSRDRKFAWLPLPFFPPPQAIIEVYTTISPNCSTVSLPSVKLQLGGYAIGAAVGFLTGVSIGWSRSSATGCIRYCDSSDHCRRTAWLPFAFFTFPSSWSASTFLIALATGFPVTVLTWSGVASVSNAYYDVARTLGAKPSFLVLKVAIPAALPHVFVGLFHGPRIVLRRAGRRRNDRRQGRSWLVSAVGPGFGRPIRTCMPR